MAKGFVLIAAPWTVLGGEGIRPRGMGGEVALQCSHLVDATGHEFAQAPERMGGDQQRVGII